MQTVSRDAADGIRIRPSPDTSVLDPATWEPVQPGVVGKLARTGDIPLGYWRDDEKTRAAFVESGGKRWVVPGDDATVEQDGTVVLLGRGSTCINTGGEKVFPEEVEAVCKEHPDVYDVLVVGVPDDRFGERVAAVVQPLPGASPSIDAIQAHCRERLAGYKVPRELFLVERVERHPTGKPDYPWARRVALSGAEAVQRA
jgi:acyl-CoA synthetase (AMP-forming)/AMP-acid ligase II